MLCGSRPRGDFVRSDLVHLGFPAERFELVCNRSGLFQRDERTHRGVPRVESRCDPLRVLLAETDAAMHERADEAAARAAYDRAFDEREPAAHNRGDDPERRSDPHAHAALVRPELVRLDVPFCVFHQDADGVELDAVISLRPCAKSARPAVGSPLRLEEREDESVVSGQHDSFPCVDETAVLGAWLPYGITPTV
jgi:hypothetical protein